MRHRESRTPFVLLLLSVAASSPLANAGVIRFVNAGLTSGANNGASWEDAFRGPLSLQAALAAATSGDDIWVAQGTYTPALAGGPSSATFALKDGVRVIGGFVGTETQSTQRDPVTHPAVLSGDLNQDGSAADSVLHVVTATGLSDAAVLDGFTVSMGHAGGLGLGQIGGGVLINGGSPRIRNCTFRDNRANGGGAVAAKQSNALLEHCTFSPNQAQLGSAVACFSGSTTIRGCVFAGAYPATGGSAGLGVWCGALSGTDPLPSIVIEDSTFSIESAAFSCPAGIAIGGSVVTARIDRSHFIGNTGCGSGAVQLDGDVRIDRCRFIANEGLFDGGAALHSFTGDFTVTNSLFAGNDRHGINTIHAGRHLRLINCTLANNGSTLPNAFGSPFHDVILPGSGQVRLENCIVWGNRSLEGDSGVVIAPGSAAPPIFDDCIVQGWGTLDTPVNGVHSFASDPLFVNTDGPDGIPDTRDDDYRLLASSPAIDRGDNSFQPHPLDLDGAPRFRDTPGVVDFTPGAAPQIDLGALEFAPPCPADLTNDGFIDDADFVVFAAAYNLLLCPDPAMPAACTADLNHDGFVDDADFVIFAAAYNDLLCP